MRGRLVVLHLLVERGNVIEVVAGNDFTQTDLKYPKRTRTIRRIPRFIGVIERRGEGQQGGIKYRTSHDMVSFFSHDLIDQ